MHIQVELYIHSDPLSIVLSKTSVVFCSSSRMLVSFKDKRLSFTVSVTNKKENAYNTQVTATYSKNLFYASISPPVCIRIFALYTYACPRGGLF